MSEVRTFRDLAASPPLVSMPGLVIHDEVALCTQACALPAQRVAELARFARDHARPLVAVLIEKGPVDEAALLEGLAASLDLAFVAEPRRIEPDVLECMPASLASQHQVVPLALGADGRLTVACTDPFDWPLWDELCQIVGRPLEKVLAPRAVIERMQRAGYGLGAETVERLVAERGDDESLRIEAIGGDLNEEQAANEPTVVNLVNRLLSEAIQARATDVHLEPFESRYRVRYRIDGVLEDVSIPVSVKLLKLALVSRIKIMANLDITEKRMPQDGRAQVSLADQSYDLRVSILPGVFGEAVNIRLQNRAMVRLDLERLGYEPEERGKIEQLIHRPHGLVLVTGPTGSGKTTTLYTCLSRINTPGRKIITVEDPVEYWMENIVQMQVRDEIGFTFARALRSMLRHDPDVMLVGEIRDRETADIAIRASLTGHLVFATLHTNDAASAVTRLLDIGIEPFLVASSINGIVAQRLVRRICEHCRRQAVDQPGADVDSAWQGAGCDVCRFTGYRGRLAVAEVLTMSPAVRKQVQQRATADEIRNQAKDESMRTLRESARRAVLAGVTTAQELLRVTMDETA